MQFCFQLISIYILFCVKIEIFRQYNATKQTYMNPWETVYNRHGERIFSPLLIFFDFFGLNLLLHGERYKR